MTATNQRHVKTADHICSNATLGERTIHPLTPTSAYRCPWCSSFTVMGEEICPEEYSNVSPLDILDSCCIIKCFFFPSIENNEEELWGGRYESNNTKAIKVKKVHLQVAPVCVIHTYNTDDVGGDYIWQTLEFFLCRSMYYSVLLSIILQCGWILLVRRYDNFFLL